MNNRILIITVGTPDRPAIDEDVINTRESFAQLFTEDAVNTLVSHHALSYRYVDYKPGQYVVFHLGTDDYPVTDQEIIDFEAQVLEARNGSLPILVTRFAVRVVTFDKL